MFSFLVCWHFFLKSVQPCPPLTRKLHPGGPDSPPGVPLVATCPLPSFPPHPAGFWLWPPHPCLVKFQSFHMRFRIFVNLRLPRPVSRHCMCPFAVHALHDPLHWLRLQVSLPTSSLPCPSRISISPHRLFFSLSFPPLSAFNLFHKWVSTSM